MLVKAVVEAGGVEVLAKSNNWVRSLLAILKKSDPPTTRCLVVLTLTRIFMLTWDYSNLIREITTPALTAFVPSCITNIENGRCSPHELHTILESFATLLPRHPTIFRTHEAKLRALLTTILSARSSGAQSGVHYSEAHRATALRILALLPSCAPKQGASDKWEETLESAIKSAHSTCDRIFRAVQEDWQSSAGVQPSLPGHQLASGDVELESQDLTGLRPWKGVFAGSERLITLLGLVDTQIATITPSSTPVRVGLIIDLLNRLFAITLPIVGRQDSTRINNQVSREEREAMFTVLPGIHTIAMRTCLAIVQRLGSGVFPLAQGLLEQILPVFQAESAHDSVRLSTYYLIAEMLSIVGPSLERNDVSELDQVLKRCTEDILPLINGSHTGTSNSNGSSNGIKQQLGLSGSDAVQTHPTNLKDVQDAASRLLCVSLSKLDSSCILLKLRAQIDRAVIITKDKHVLLASVMNPSRKQNGQQPQASLLPILTRHFGAAPEVESLLRPRLPPVTPARQPTALSEDSVLRDNGDDDIDMQATDTEETEPTMGLLDELAQYSNASTGATALDSLDSSEPQDVLNGKRRALEDADDVSAKRLRASPAAQTLPADTMQTLPESDASTAKVNIPKVVAFDEPPEHQTYAGASTETTQLPTTTKETSSPNEVGGDDDSDFEMPPLTMEPDTDPEDE